MHKPIDLHDMPNGPHGWDDEVEFNTQCSSQWDSLCHFNHQATAQGYNGTRPTKEDLTQDALNWDKEQAIPTLNHWHSRGGVVARGVLIDAKLYFEKIGRDFDPHQLHCISVADIEAIAKDQKVELKLGDVIIVRTGNTEALEGLDGPAQLAKMHSGGAAGVRGDMETVRWFWNKHFAAVAGDAMAFENFPPLEGDYNALVLHQYFLTSFGMPIGELWDLKQLSKTCKKLGRYSFLLTSVPLNVPGLVGSPPNALAVF